MLFFIQLSLVFIGMYVMYRLTESGSFLASLLVFLLLFLSLNFSEIYYYQVKLAPWDLTFKTGLLEPCQVKYINWEDCRDFDAKNFECLAFVQYN